MSRSEPTAPKRRVQLHRTGKMRLQMLYGVLGFLVIVQAWAVIGSSRVQGLRAPMIIGPVILIFGMFLVRSIVVNERELMMSGRETRGRVTEAVSSPKGAMVSFQYLDSESRTHDRTARDTSGRLHEGDPVAVYYDAERPGRCVISPGSFYQVLSDD